ncbi:MAG: plasmid pRiA4b ORF-3 family protein [Bacillota bacterium]
MTKILQLKISLKKSDPEIWRRILIKEVNTFEDLHETIQVVMDWGDYHLHEFRIDKTKYIGNQPPPPYSMNKRTFIDERKTKLSEYLDKKGNVINYLYDPGDNWEHLIKVEEVKDEEKYKYRKKNYPVVIDGENAAPPEDVGGIPGYYQMLEAISDSDHPEHEMFDHWLKKDFNPYQFNMIKVNEKLHDYLDL